MSVISRGAFAGAFEVERLMECGRIIGLMDDETRQVIDTWVDWYRGTPWPIDWGQVRSAVAQRGVGVDWRPPD